MRVNKAAAAIYMRERAPFESGNLVGRKVGRYGEPAMGLLPQQWVARIRLHLAEAKEVRGGVYIIHSYSTPIAWVTSDNEVVIPDVTYSPTTTRHQTLVRRALGGEHDGSE